MFPRFGQFPLEIQCMIFEQALPPSQVLNFRFWIHRKRGGFTDIINFGSALAKFPGVSSLLETCKASNDTMHRRAGLEKIELFRPPVRHFLDTTETLPDTLNYMYLRPSIDVFMVSIDSLVRLYQLGGSIGSLCNIEQLAVTGIDYNLFDDWNEVEITNLFEKFCNVIQKHCPALKKIHLVIGDTEAVPFGHVKDSLELTRDLRLIEIDEDFRNFDFDEDKERQEYYELESLKAEMNNTFNYAQHAMSEIKDYAERTEMLSDSAVADYWRKMKVVPAIVGWLEGGKRPQLWFPALSSVLPCYDDGTPFDRYEGIFDLFEGADL
ncbi:hypothetical protein BELL_0598g00040 [Botrytis elliptica]|uniref:2EXR domain-containing protein n=1 Tax=Botrytis elliptica TaxID=278938 RepID=A0A4Z1JC62_9HELO|nr:hypothetical protein EAE99_010209 [Botrytis elliptica]TGO71275.1 hypothetical protein BELL_0598g00040 [Botrytis elliptica]